MDLIPQTPSDPPRVFRRLVCLSQAAIADSCSWPIIRHFKLRRRHVPDRLEQSAVTEPIDPFQGGIFNGIDVSPGTAVSDHLGLVQPVDGLDQGVVVRVTDTADSPGRPPDQPHHHSQSCGTNGPAPYPAGRDGASAARQYNALRQCGRG